MKISKLLLLILVFLTTAAGAAFMLRDSLIDMVIEKQFIKFEVKFGEKLTFEGATLESFNRVTLRGVQVGHDRWLFIQRLDITLERDSLFSSLLQGKRPKVQWVYMMQPTMLVKGQSLKDIAKVQQLRFKKLLSRMKAYSTSGNIATKQVSQQANGNSLNRLPHIEVSGGKLSGSKGLLFIHQANFSVRDGLIKGNWRGEAPETGYCTAEASINRAKVVCNENFKFPINSQFEVAGRQVEWERGEQGAIKLQGVHVTTIKKAQKSKLPFSELKVDVLAGLTPNLDGQFPLEAALVFPGGGRLITKGFASMQEIELSTQVSGFPMHTLASGQSGTLNANARIWSRWRDGAATLEGKLSLLSAIIRNNKLAEGAVGPLNLSMDGTVRLMWVPRNPKRFKVSVTNANATIGDITGRLSASWDQVAYFPHLKAEFDVPQIKAQRFAASIPNGLMPHLQPIELAGKMGFSGRIDLDYGNLDKTILKIKPKLRRLKVLSYNEEIDFSALDGSFDTRFEMPSGEILTRVAGPETERWVELNEMPPLLPKAVISQEDGGFFKHNGISLFHLRGSLVKNLKKGKFVRGGSTLTMQLIKNLFLHRRKTLSRKLEEVCLAWLIEQKLTKNELITLYLNIVEFGTDLFGIKEAAEHYFNKLPKDLTPEEISAITRLLPGPRLYGPFFERKRLSKAYTNRVNRLLKLLQKRKYLSAEDWAPITPTSLWDKPPVPTQLIEDQVSPATDSSLQVPDDKAKGDEDQDSEVLRAREVFDTF